MTITTNRSELYYVTLQSNVILNPICLRGLRKVTRRQTDAIANTIANSLGRHVVNLSLILVKRFYDVRFTLFTSPGAPPVCLSLPSSFAIGPRWRTDSCSLQGEVRAASLDRSKPSKTTSSLKMQPCEGSKAGRGAGEQRSSAKSRSAQLDAPPPHIKAAQRGLHWL